jgi:hypothetical protein
LSPFSSGREAVGEDNDRRVRHRGLSYELPAKNAIVSDLPQPCVCQITPPRRSPSSAAASVVMLGAMAGTVASQAFNPLLTAGALAPWIALGMAGTTLLIALLARAALKGTRPQ